MTSTIRTPTPDDFMRMAGGEPDEEYDDLDPMTSFEHRLRMLESLVGELAVGQPVAAVLDSARCTYCADLRDEVHLLQDLHSQVGHSYADAVALVEQIEGIVKKSTSQVSLAVKAAIEAWRTPADTTETPSPAPGASAVDEAAGPGIPSQDVPQASAGEGLPPQQLVEPAVQCAACSRYFADADLLGRHNCPMSQNVPAADADVAAWRSYARGLGYTGPDVDTMNRSQIRTMLGVEQPVTAVE